MPPIKGDEILSLIPRSTVDQNEEGEQNLQSLGSGVLFQGTRREKQSHRGQDDEMVMKTCNGCLGQQT